MSKRTNNDNVTGTLAFTFYAFSVNKTSLHNQSNPVDTQVQSISVQSTEISKPVFSLDSAPTTTETSEIKESNSSVQVATLPPVAQCFSSASSTSSEETTNETTTTNRSSPATTPRLRPLVHYSKSLTRLNEPTKPHLSIKRYSFREANNIESIEQIYQNLRQQSQATRPLGRGRIVGVKSQSNLNKIIVDGSIEQGKWLVYASFAYYFIFFRKFNRAYRKYNFLLRPRRRHTFLSLFFFLNTILFNLLCVCWQ